MSAQEEERNILLVFQVPLKTSHNPRWSMFGASSSPLLTPSDSAFSLPASSPLFSGVVFPGWGQPTAGPTPPATSFLFGAGSTSCWGQPAAAPPTSPATPSFLAGSAVGWGQTDTSSPPPAAGFTFGASSAADWGKFGMSSAPSSSAPSSGFGAAAGWGPSPPTALSSAAGPASGAGGLSSWGGQSMPACSPSAAMFQASGAPASGQVAAGPMSPSTRPFFAAAGQAGGHSFSFAAAQGSPFGAARMAGPAGAGPSALPFSRVNAPPPRGVDHAQLGVTEARGPFLGAPGTTRLELDPLAAIRCTVQHYLTSDDGLLVEEDIAGVRATMDRVYSRARRQGSLVVDRDANGRSTAPGHQPDLWFFR